MNETGENMSNGNIGTDTAAVLALLADTSRAGRGGLYGFGGEGGFGCAGPYATMSSVQHGLDCNRQVYQTGNQTVLTGLENLERANSFQNVCDSIARHDTRNSDGQFQMELRNSDRTAALQQAINDSRAEAKDCCCDIRLELSQKETRDVERFCELKANQAAIEAKIDANQKFNELYAENQSLKTQVACGCTTGCTQRCHGHHGR